MGGRMMKAYIQVGENGRILAVTREEEFADGFQMVDNAPDDILSACGDYVYKGGEFERDHAATNALESLKAEAEAAAAMNRQVRDAVLMLIQAQAVMLSDEQAMSVSMLFEEWAVGASYKTGGICRHDGNLYRVLQDVPSAQAEHTPDKATSLYKRIGEPTGGIFPWSQPLGAADAYKKGDKVTHKGKTWVSTVDANVWEPGVYGWDEVQA